MAKKTLEGFWAMIRYDLKCDQGHAFDSWFANAAAFDRLSAAGHLSCPDCGTSAVTKALMAPGVATSTAVAPPDAPAETLRGPRNDREAALQELRRQVEENSEYVGMSFAAEARAMHEGRSPDRAIHGEAKLDEARKLLEDGVPVMPLPFRTNRKTN